jgi:hypothetical protein
MRRVRANLTLLTSFKLLKHEYDRGTGQRLLACAKNKVRNEPLCDAAWKFSSVMCK